MWRFYAVADGRRNAKLLCLPTAPMVELLASLRTVL
jgi:hypothetical protein